MKQWLSRKWVRVLLGHVLGIGLVGTLIILASVFLGSACPTYLIFGFCCPFCGMTRAHLAALRFDFSAAFYYHPAFFGGIPLLWLLTHPQIFTQKRQKVFWWIVTLLLALTLLITYIVRVCTYGFDFFA